MEVDLRLPDLLTGNVGDALPVDGGSACRAYERQRDGPCPAHSPISAAKSWKFGCAAVHRGVDQTPSSAVRGSGMGDFSASSTAASSLLRTRLSIWSSCSWSTTSSERSHRS